ncbi:MAG: hypothetical protein ACREMT_04950, partial [Vulcanimicrobiaceae bacterium]
MRYVSFTTNRDGTGNSAGGILESPSRVRAFRSGISREAFIALQPARRAEQLKSLDESLSLDAVRLLAPLHPHKNVFCVGRNYLAHAEEGARARGQELKLPAVPTFFSKAPTAIANPDEALELDPAISSEYD